MFTQIQPDTRTLTHTVARSHRAWQVGVSLNLIIHPILFKKSNDIKKCVMNLHILKLCRENMIIRTIFCPIENEHLHVCVWVRASDMPSSIFKLIIRLYFSFFSFLSTLNHLLSLLMHPKTTGYVHKNPTPVLKEQKNHHHHHQTIQYIQIHIIGRRASHSTYRHFLI